MKRLTGNSVEQNPGTNETLNRGSLLIRSGDEEGTVITVNVRKGVETDGKFSYRKGADQIIDTASFNNFKAEFDALIQKIWEQLRADGVINFEDS
jgi:hypothetical protein